VAVLCCSSVFTVNVAKPNVKEKFYLCTWYGKCSNVASALLQIEERKDSDDEKSDRNKPWWRKRFVSAMPKGKIMSV